MGPVLELVTAKTMDIKSRTETPIVEITKIDLFIILNYITFPF